MGIAGRAARPAWLVLAALTLANTLSFMDRFLMNVVSQPIKEELNLADWELGLLNGTAFAISSALIGLPVARLAERFNRSNVVAACIVVWSGMTALCGMAHSTAQMLLFRTGVGVGEAGATPASHSLIADYFQPSRRATALAIFTVGMPLGAVAGSVMGGYFIDQYGWRSAFYLLGFPGVLVALFVKATIREVPRGRLDPQAQGSELPNSRAVFLRLIASPTTRHTMAGLASAIMVAIAASTFYGPFLVRKFDISYTLMGVVLSATYLAGGALGNLLGGIVADRRGRKDRRWYPWSAMGGLLVGFPLYIVAYSRSSLVGTAIFLFMASVLALTYTAPAFAVLHNIVEARTRATMVAIVQIASSVIGGGLGPLLGGATIDLMTHFLSGGSFAGSCPGGEAAPASSAELGLFCHAILAQATEWAMILWAPLMLWPAWHFWQASRTVRDEWQ